MKPFERLLIACVLVTVMLVTAHCNLEITDDDLDLWVQSAVGLDKIEEVINDPEVKFDIKVKAIVKMVEYRQSRRMRDILKKAPDREKLALAAKEKLIELMNNAKDDTTKALAKDGLMMIMRYLSDDDQDKIKKAVAEWVFEGLDEKSDTETIKKQIESRINLPMIADLGTYGIDGAALLLSHGFGVEKMFKYITSFKDDAHKKIALDGMKKLHSIDNIEIMPSHLDLIYSLKTIDAVNYFMDMYEDKTVSAEIGSDAFGLAIELFDDPLIKDKVAQLLPRLYKFMQKKNYEDRQLSAHYILVHGGVGELPKVLEAFKDDGVFDADVFESQQFLRDFCRMDVATLKGDKYPPLVKTLDSENKVAKATAIVCLKYIDDPAAADPLQKLTKDETDLKTYLGGKLTVGLLTENAISGIEAITKLKEELDKGAIDKETYEVKKFLYQDEFELGGEFLDQAVEAKFPTALKAYKAAIEAEKNAKAGKKGPAAGKNGSGKKIEDKKADEKKADDKKADDKKADDKKADEKADEKADADKA